MPGRRRVWVSTVLLAVVAAAITLGASSVVRPPALDDPVRPAATARHGALDATPVRTDDGLRHRLSLASWMALLTAALLAVDAAMLGPGRPAPALRPASGRRAPSRAPPRA